MRIVPTAGLGVADQPSPIADADTSEIRRRTRTIRSTVGVLERDYPWRAARVVTTRDIHEP